MMKAAVKETAALRNGVEMPLVGLGVMHMYGSECVRAICEAVDAGYRMIDTAAIYGNEGAVGKGIRSRQGYVVYHHQTVGAGCQL